MFLSTANSFVNGGVSSRGGSAASLAVSGYAPRTWREVTYGEPTSWLPTVPVPTS